MAQKQTPERDAVLIDRLGGPTAVAAALSIENPQTVSNWKRRGIPLRVRVSDPFKKLASKVAKPIERRAVGRSA
jgi:hypothetical protein